MTIRPGIEGPLGMQTAFLTREPVFTSAELAAFLSERGIAGPDEQAGLWLDHWQRAGTVVEIRRTPGLFSVVWPGVDPGRFQPVPELVATKMTPDAVVSHRSAMTFHGCGHSVWRHFVYSAAVPAPPLTYRAARYEGVPFPDALTDSGNAMWGVESVAYGDGRVRVTSLERTLVDVLAQPLYGGGWEEIWRAASPTKIPDIEKVAAYTALLGDAALRARVGFYVSQHLDLWQLTDTVLELFREDSPAGPYYLDANDPAPALLVEEWDLIVPLHVLEQHWEELNSYTIAMS